ncbi:ATP-dependent zinc metalloprotease FtsH [Wenyingzhuangia sp. 2_MG-2023]|uniref:ATP-dependent zinc metalloprotease FtsH n=1 Tax=Wenyingzhuangia sp. 2_MG-2023 TaxID=3062639 RepID=UPI0026E45184|nr:ATP-dependent zinc metalloprotease FtsH [Wenyingzhuangia sp. 2_MG-2023]MDO6737822.1 ATP-dependent zinc metalloprotease FtsH [Wenyingzhuangia sp. 2_MG-2023]MDO6802105.1 ATP-dependent zinc metalloprotease FtsH [Wenyingzhuangia sp. 1_MG-2023]
MNKENKNQPKPNGMKPKFNSYWIYAAIIAVILSFNFFGNAENTGEISKNKFEEYLRSNSIQKIFIINDDYAKIYLTDEAEKQLTPKTEDNSLPWVSSKRTLTYNFGSLENFENLIKDSKAKYNLALDLQFDNQTNILESLIGFLPFIILLVVWIFIMRRMSGGGAGGGAGGQIFSIGKSKAKLFDENQKIKISFKDVAGLVGAKEEVQEIVDFLKNPSKYTNLGGKIPKGALLVGPPGTGKTLLAKAVAGEAGVPFFSLSGSDFVEMFVGVGASRVRDLFKQAAQKSPSIIFIDEIDAIGRARGKNNMTGGNDERENTLNQLLTEMDGFGTDTNVIVIAATNRADVLDKALMRAGRFDRQIYVDLPDLNERSAIFKVHIKSLKLGTDVNLEFLAQQTPGFSGADIANLCNEAALMAARKDKKEIENQDFLDSVDRIVGGLEKKNKIISLKEKKTIAFHEAGHATASWMLEHAAPLVKVTIVPRGQSLGAAWYLPEERMIVQTEQMLDEMCATLAGRAAEKIIFNKISTGALSDLEKVTKQARAMVSIYGLSEKIGNLTYYDSSGQEYGFTKPYSDTTAKLIDDEISVLIESQYQRAIEILTENKDKLTELAERLLEKEVIFKDDLIKIFGERAFLTEGEKLEQKLEEQIEKSNPEASN